MFNFSLKNLYDDKVASYLFLIDLCKWISVIIVVLGLFLAFWFNNYWLAVIGGILLVIIGCIIALVAHFIKKKLATLLAKGGSLVEGTEKYVINQATYQAKKIFPKNNNK